METAAALNSTPPLVAIINTSLETIELLQELCADEAIETVGAYVTEFKRGQRDLQAFFQQYQPHAVIYDIALPYVENWNFFQEHVLGRHFIPEQCFVITTTNRAALEQLVGQTPAFEMVGRPFDLSSILTAIKQAIAASER